MNDLLQWTLAWNIKSSAEQVSNCEKHGLQSNKKSKEIINCRVSKIYECIFRDMYRWVEVSKTVMSVN